VSATCPCGLVSFKVLSTRDHDIPGVVLRRRECAEGHRWTTWEVSEAFISHVGRKASRDILFTIDKGNRVRQQVLERKERVLALAKRGVRSGKIAEIVGLTSQRVRQIKNGTY